MTGTLVLTSHGANRKVSTTESGRLIYAIALLDNGTEREEETDTCDKDRWIAQEARNTARYERLGKAGRLKEAGALKESPPSSSASHSQANAAGN